MALFNLNLTKIGTGNNNRSTLLFYFHFEINIFGHFWQFDILVTSRSNLIWEWVKNPPSPKIPGLFQVKSAQYQHANAIYMTSKANSCFFLLRKWHFFLYHCMAWTVRPKHWNIPISHFTRICHLACIWHITSPVDVTSHHPHMSHAHICHIACICQITHICHIAPHMSCAPKCHISPTRWFLEMTKICHLPVRKLPEVSLNRQLAYIWWVLEASETLFRKLFGVNLFTGMPPHIPGEKSGI